MKQRYVIIWHRGTNPTLNATPIDVDIKETEDAIRRYLKIRGALLSTIQVSEVEIVIHNICII